MAFWPYSPNFSQNLVTIDQFLQAHGYTRNAAAGIAGDIYGESGGNPEAVGSGGWGLIGWTPSTPGQYANLYPTGNPQTDFAHQLQGILQYNVAEATPSAMAALQAATSPTAAAQVYSAQFERPAVLYSDVNPGISAAVYQSAGTYAGSTERLPNGQIVRTSGGVPLSTIGGVTGATDSAILASRTSGSTTTGTPTGTGQIVLAHFPLFGNVTVPSSLIVRGALLLLGLFLVYVAMKGMTSEGSGPAEIISTGADSATKDAGRAAETAAGAAA